MLPGIGRRLESRSNAERTDYTKPIEIEMVDANIEDLIFAEVLVNSLDAMWTSGSYKGGRDARYYL